MPTATPAPHPSATAETQVIGSLRPRAQSAVAVSDNASTLAARTRKRRGRGWILAGIIAVLVAIAATLGWYFGVGPGSQVAIPNELAGMSIEQATATLTDLGLTVNPTNGETDSPTVAVGLVADTDPPLGSYITHGGPVQLLISTGPKAITVPVFAGMTEDQAKDAITAAPFTLADPVIRQFDPSIAAGTVIDALAADGTSLTGVATYGELQPVTLVVSAGPLPDVSGKSVADATTALQAAGLEFGAVREAEYSADVPEGNAIRLQVGDGTAPVRVGDTVDIITSMGVEQVAVPDVVGKTWADAKPILQEAGFELDYNIFADVQPGQVIVSGLDPTAGTLADKGSTVRVSFSF